MGTTSVYSTRATYKMIKDNEALVETFRSRGVDILEYAQKFEQTIIAHIFHALCAYITCFCKPTGPEDFRHGLLSQWRAYGVDGGYALQFSRKKLQSAVENVNKAQGLNYDLQDVYYTSENPLKAKVLGHTDSFLRAYRNHLDELASGDPDPCAVVNDARLEDGEKKRILGDNAATLFRVAEYSC